jgi:hypothetical protein
MTDEVTFYDIVTVKGRSPGESDLVGYVAGISEGTDRHFSVFIFSHGESLFVAATDVTQTGYRVDPKSVFVDEVKVVVDQHGRGRVRRDD